MKLKQIAKGIKEKDMFEGFNEEELSEQYPEYFSFEELKDIRSYVGKKRYIESHLGKPLGSGSARSVYRVDKTKVLKLAKNKKGLAQNYVETDWYGDHYFSDILAKVLDFDEDDHYWVEMELAFKVSVNDFKRLWGIDFKNLGVYLHNKYSENNPYKRLGRWGLDEKIKEQLDENDEVQHLVDFMFQTDSPPGDLLRKSSWGKVFREDGEYLVLVDFGLTNSVYDSYYS